MNSANEIPWYIVTTCLIGCAHTQNDLIDLMYVFSFVRWRNETVKSIKMISATCIVETRSAETDFLVSIHSVLDKYLISIIGATHFITHSFCKHMLLLLQVTSAVRWVFLLVPVSSPCLSWLMWLSTTCVACTAVNRSMPCMLGSDDPHCLCPVLYGWTYDIWQHATLQHMKSVILHVQNKVSLKIPGIPHSSKQWYCIWCDSNVDCWSKWNSENIRSSGIRF